MRLFAYGTLMFPEVWRRISIGEFPSRPAKLRGYSIYGVREAVFPAIVRTDGDCMVDGLLYEGLDEDTLFELDTYESSFYERVLVSVQTADGAEHECFAYVVPDSRRDMLTNEPWDVNKFQERHLETYLHG